MLGQFRIHYIVFFLALFLLCTLITVHAAPVPTPRLNRNLDLQQQYQNPLLGEQVIELSTDQERFIALYLEQQITDSQGGALILHDVGNTPDWPYLLKQTRRYLPEVGWSTLAIDLPTPRREAVGILPLDGANNPVSETPQTTEDWENRVLARIAMGITHLNQQGIFNIAIIGYGDGGYWGTRYLAERLSPEEEAGYALILYEAPLTYSDLPNLLSQLNIPILDIYMNDSDFAQRQAKLRKAAVMREDPDDYLQIHDALRQSFYSTASIDRSTRRIWGWLKNHAAGSEVTMENKTLF